MRIGTAEMKFLTFVQNTEINTSEWLKKCGENLKHTMSLVNQELISCKGCVTLTRLKLLQNLHRNVLHNENDLGKLQEIVWKKLWMERANLFQLHGLLVNGLIFKFHQTKRLEIQALVGENFSLRFDSTRPPRLFLLSFFHPSWRIVRSYRSHLEVRDPIWGDDWSQCLHRQSHSWDFPGFF